MTTRRSFLATSALAAAAPAFNLGRFRLFADSPTEYSARAIAIMQRSIVIDMLSPLNINFSITEKWLTDPKAFTAKEFEEFRASGITALHVAVGTGGADV